MDKGASHPLNVELGRQEGEGTGEEAGWKFRNSGPELFPGH